MSDTQHSSTPWHARHDEHDNLLSIAYGDDRTLLRPALGTIHETGVVRAILTSCALDASNEEQHYADIAFLLRAVNSHDDLLAACKDAESTLEVVIAQGDLGLQAISGETIDVVRAAIAKAETR